jgi:rhodanese-related sulfurtransferase
MKIAEAPRHRLGYLEARPGDVAGRSDLFVVDVRDEVDLTGDFGHIHGVTHLPADRLLREGVPGVSVDAPIVVVCQNGRRSQACAIRLVADHGFTEVYHLVGGMVRWTAEERPVARVPTWRAID